MIPLSVIFRKLCARFPVLRLEWQFGAQTEGKIGESLCGLPYWRAIGGRWSHKVFGAEVARSPHGSGPVCAKPRLHAGMVAILAAALLLFSGCQQKGYVQIGGYAQGGSWSVKYNTDGVKVAPARVQAGVEAILQDIDRTLSGYNKGSELSRLNAGDTIRPSEMLVGMYDRCYRLWQETGGALDVAAGPLFDIWGFGFKNGSLPSDAEVAAAMAVSGMGRLVPRMEDALLPDGRICASALVDYSASGDSSPAPLHNRSAIPISLDRNSGRLTDPLPQLNFNAVAQGYSCDTVAAYLASLGVRDMLVDIGEIICRGVNQAGKPWRIGVDRPTDGNNSPGADLDGLWESVGYANGSAAPAGISTMPFQGIVTSGNYRKFYVKDGVKYAHTIDPRTGRPAENSLLSATVVAPTAEEADGIATFLMVIGLEKAQSYILSKPDLEAYLIYRTPDGSMAEWHSPGFNLK